MANPPKILPLLFIFCFVFSPTTTCFSNQTDLLSLLAFKSALTDPLGALISWNKTTHFCSWDGVECGSRHPDRVVAINLMSRGLVGSISPHLGNLSFLKAIILRNNTFHGQIPQQITQLPRLEFVEFSNNSLIGSIPGNLSHCPNLVYLNLINNKLSGMIPTELGFLTKLKDLGFSKNTLSGPIPSSLGNITTLEMLSLASCGLIGEIPESLARLRRLQFLQLSDNNFTGTIPSGLFNLSAIEHISFFGNHLHGVLPSTIGLTLPNAKILYFGENQFSGTIPNSISNASNLEQIALAWNHFTGPMPSNIGALTHLQGFFIQSNLIEDDISFISSFTNATELKYLEIGNNRLSGSLPESIGNLSINLRSLYMHMNGIHGKVPSGIGNLIGLTSLFLFENFLEGPLPLTITKLSNLVDLVVGGNRFSDKLPPLFGLNFTTLSHLYLNVNNFSGNLPSTLGNCTSLIELDLSHNSFNGLIPQEIMHLSSISIIFNLSNNALEGLIPYEVGSLANLNTLDLSNNKLSGQIPNSISSCTSLQQIYLEGNLLEGEIPTGINALTGLQDLDLSRNNLSGPIPSFLAKLNLAKLNLSFNRLEGEVPILGIFKKNASISLDGNKELCGGISELKLPPCSSAKPRKRNYLSTLMKILIPVMAAGGICLFLLAFFFYRKRMSRENVTPVSSVTGVHFMRLSYADLLRATGGFSETNFLGAGRFGSVYKGILDVSQMVVAVKVLNLFVRGASKSFMAECNALRNVRHRNLLKIISVCESIDFQGNDFKALIYEFKANGSLDKWLHQICEEEEEEAAANKLNMIQRFNIAIDIAQAIKYLHSGTSSSIVHGDLKPSNILLDHDLAAYVGDFGLAKIISDIVPSNGSSSSTGIKGTIGYVPPEYGTSHSVSTQGDVYSYGIVLLEMFTNKRPTDESFKDHVNLHSAVAAALPDRVMEIVDPLFRADMNNNKIRDCMAAILNIGVSCSKEMPRDRMSMTDVVNELNKMRKFLST